VSDSAANRRPQASRAPGSAAAASANARSASVSGGSARSSARSWAGSSRRSASNRSRIWAGRPPDHQCHQGAKIGVGAERAEEHRGLGGRERRHREHPVGAGAGAHGHQQQPGRGRGDGGGVGLAAVGHPHPEPRPPPDRRRALRRREAATASRNQAASREGAHTRRPDEADPAVRPAPRRAPGARPTTRRARRSARRAGVRARPTARAPDRTPTGRAAPHVRGRWGVAAEVDPGVGRRDGGGSGRQVGGDLLVLDPGRGGHGRRAPPRWRGRRAFGAGRGQRARSSPGRAWPVLAGGCQQRLHPPVDAVREGEHRVPARLLRGAAVQHPPREAPDRVQVGLGALPQPPARARGETKPGVPPRSPEPVHGGEPEVREPPPRVTFGAAVEHVAGG
jgi:hypothetical protein